MVGLLISIETLFLSVYKVILAYQGDQPYIFISYCHQDSEQVFPEIRALSKSGCRVWYDEGIEPGSEWPEEIAKVLLDSTVFIVFISNRSVQSRNVRNEINFALNRQKMFIAIYLEETELPPGLELRIGDMQAIKKWQFVEKEYARKLLSALPDEVLETIKDGKTTSGLKIEWTALLRGAQYSPIRGILVPQGREVLFFDSKSPDTWVYALFGYSGNYLWEVPRRDQDLILEKVAWDFDYLYLTGRVEVESDLRFVRKYWLREGDEEVSFAWYEVSNCSHQKYEKIPEWDNLKWVPVAQIESRNIASSLDTKVQVINGALQVQNSKTKKSSSWMLPLNDSITVLEITDNQKLIVALSSGHVCMLAHE